MVMRRIGRRYPGRGTLIEQGHRYEKVFVVVMEGRTYERPRKMMGF